VPPAPVPAYSYHFSGQASKVGERWAPWVTRSWRGGDPLSGATSPPGHAGPCSDGREGQHDPAHAHRVRAVGVHRCASTTSAHLRRGVPGHPAASPPDARWPRSSSSRPADQADAQDTVDAVRRHVTEGSRSSSASARPPPGWPRPRWANVRCWPCRRAPTTCSAVREATIAGLAAGLVATGAVPADGATAGPSCSRSGPGTEPRPRGGRRCVHRAPRRARAVWIRPP